MRDGILDKAVVIDIASSFAAAIIILAVCLRLGGFNFFAPWLIVTPVVMFACGLIRGENAKRIIAKGVALSTFQLLLLVLGTFDSPITLLFGIPLIVAPAVAGAATRRWLRSTSPSDV